MNLYEHTIVARQDTSPAQVKQLTEKYSKIVEKNEGEIVQTEDWGEKNEGEIVQTEDWGLLNLAYIIKKNKKGIYMHFKIKGPGKIIDELEKNEAIDKNLLRYMTVKVKKFNLEAKYFSKKDEYEKKEYKKEFNRD